MDRLRVFEFETHAARSACAGTYHADVEQHRQPQFLHLFPKRIEARVIRKKLLPRGIQLSYAVQAQVFDLANLIQSDLSLPEIDDTKAHKDIRVLLDVLDDVAVGHGRKTGDRL